jgi:hypothetical protein
MAYDNTNTGLISKNDKKTTDAHPNIKGQCDIEGVQYWVAGWLKQRNDGSGSFYSLKFERKDAKPAATPAPKPAAPKPAPVRVAPAAASSGFDDMGDDIPFVSCGMDYDMTTSKARKLARYDY